MVGGGCAPPTYAPVLGAKVPSLKIGLGQHRQTLSSPDTVYAVCLNYPKLNKKGKRQNNLTATKGKGPDNATWSRNLLEMQESGGEGGGVGGGGWHTPDHTLFIYLFIYFLILCRAQGT